MTDRARRAPPPFRMAQVRRVVRLTPRLVRVELAGADLVGLRVDAPAASVRLLLPEPSGLVLPAWSDNQFLLTDGRRPLIRTLTPLDVDGDAGRMNVAVVRHGRGALHDWLAVVRAGDEVAVSGPGRGYAFDPEAPGLLVAGDEAALPAIGQLLTVVGPDTVVRAMVELDDASARLEVDPFGPVEFLVRVPGQPSGARLVDAVRDASLPPAWRVWVAGEASAVHRIRRDLLDHRRLPRERVAVHGYWKDSRRSPDLHRSPPGSPGMLGDE